MGALLGALGKAIFDTIVNPQSAGNQSESVSVALANIAGILANLADGLGHFIDAIYTAWQAEVDKGKQIGADLIKAQSDTGAVIDRLAFTILPNTIKNAVGYVYSDGIVPLRVKVTRLENDLADLQKRVSTLEGWRTKHVDPVLSDLQQWQHDFDKHDRPYVNVLEDWIAHGDHFASWATPLIARPLYNHLADPAHDILRTQWALLFTRTWASDPDLTTDAIDAWFNAP